MKTLTIGPDHRTALRAAQKRAQAKPIPRATLAAHALPTGHTGTVTLADREKHPKPTRPQSETVELPGGFRVAMSYEDQPAGVCLHLSISVGHPGRVPHPKAVTTILDALDLPNMIFVARPWGEEYTVDGQPGGFAVNLLILTVSTPAGHA